MYAVALTALFGVSAAYHRGRWGDRVQAMLRRADHSTILVFIAGTFTPLAVTVTHGRALVLLLIGMWSAAAIGVAIRMVWHHVKPSAVAWVYAAVGLSAVSVLPALFCRGGVASFVLFVLGGIGYLAGAMVYARRRPDPSPTVFGFHEVFHSLTVVAAALQFTGLTLAVLGTPS